MSGPSEKDRVLEGVNVFVDGDLFASGAPFFASEGVASASESARLRQVRVQGRPLSFVVAGTPTRLPFRRCEGCHLHYTVAASTKTDFRVYVSTLKTP